MATACLDGERIGDWDSFHAECRRVFGFPAFYAGNMDAWVDCLSYLRDEDGMTTFRLGADEILRIEVTHSDLLRKNAPDILDDLTFCIAAINERYEDYGEKPALHLVLL